MRAQSADLWEPWQHSPNENINCLFRQCFSNGTDFLSYSPAPRKLPFTSSFFRSIEYPVPIRAVIDEMFVKIQGKQQYK